MSAHRTPLDTGRMYWRRIGYLYPMASRLMLAIVIATATILPALHTNVAHALDAGGDTSVVDPTTEEPISILENAREPESANIRLKIPLLSGESADDGRYYASIAAVTGGTIKYEGWPIDIGDNGSWLSTNGDGSLDLWFTPAANRNIDASFTYVLYHYDENWESYDTSATSTATIPITPVDVAPTLTTDNGFVGTGLTGTYYLGDYNLTGPSSVRLDSAIDFQSTITSPNPATVWDMPGMNPEDFSVRWTGKIKAPVDGDYTLRTTSDDGVRLWVDGATVIDNWTTHGPVDDYTDTLHFAAGSTHTIELDFYERGGGEQINLSWQNPESGGYVTIPTSALFDGSVRPQLTYLSGGSATYADDAVSIGDVDSATMSGATVAIVGNYHSSEDSLQFTNQNGITGSWSSGTGVLTLTGTASIADYQAALRSVKYYNSNTDPNTDIRTLHFTVNDGTEDSNYTSRDVVFSAENEPPEIIQGDSTNVTMSEDADPTPFSLELNAQDPNFQPIGWSIRGEAGHGTASVDANGNTVSVHYTPQLHYTGSDSFVVQASDGDGGTDTITVHVTIEPFTDSDGIDTSVEDTAPNNGDVNNDGIVDSKQSNVASFVNNDTGRHITMAVDHACTLSDVSAQSPTTVGVSDKGYSYPLGLANFTADCGSDGYTATVTQYYFNPPNGNFVARKFMNGAYEAIPNATVSRQTIGGQSVLVISYQATDGDTLDDDGTINGIIVDPAGPAVADTPSSTSTSAGQTQTKQDTSDSLADTGATIGLYVLAASSLFLVGVSASRRRATAKARN